jgi:hypothetical protein
VSAWLVPVGQADIGKTELNATISSGGCKVAQVSGAE